MNISRIEDFSPILAATDASADPAFLELDQEKVKEKANEKSKEKSKANRCSCCSKKLSLSDFSCGKCHTRFCGLHRLPEAHHCSHDFVAEGKKTLERQLVKVTAEKVAHI